jgi:hypothetical protein
LSDYFDVWTTGGGWVFSSVGIVPVAARVAARRAADDVVGDAGGSAQCRGTLTLF